MKTITRFVCLLALLGLAASSNEDALTLILQHMNRSGDPCEDFQQFSSGKFLDVHEGEEVYTLQQIIIDKYNGKLQKIFDELKDMESYDDSNSVEEKVSGLYNTCLYSRGETHSFKHFLELMSPDLDLTWPQFTPHGGKWPKERFQWLVTLARLRRFGETKFVLPMSIYPKPEDSSQLVVGLDKHPITGISELENTDDWLFLLDVPRKKAALLASNITDLERDLQALAEQKSKTEYLTIEEVEERTNLSIGQYLEIAFGSSFDSSYRLEIKELAYLEGLKNVIDRYDSEVVATYLMLAFVRQLEKGDGSEANRADPDKCAARVGVLMQPAIEFLYKNFYFEEGELQRNIEEVQRIFHIISNTFMARLEGNRLNLTAAEVQHLQEKLRTMTVTVGKLPNVEDQRGFLTDFYADLNLSEDRDFAAAQLKVLEHLNRKVLEQLDRPLLRGKKYYLLDSEMNVNSHGTFYDYNNSIALSYLSLLEPYFSPEMHDVFKMSHLGYLLANHILLSYDPFYLHFDSMGNNTTMLAKFEKENQGYIDGISCLNRTEARNSMDDRVLAVFALELIYDSSFGKDSNLSQEQPWFFKVPLEQLFLLNFAQLLIGSAEGWYGDRNDVSLHAAVSNLKAFGEVFSCPANATLNPPVKCAIW